VQKSALILAIVLGAHGLAQAAPDAATIFVSPEAPAVGGPLRAVAVADGPIEGALVVRSPGGDEIARPNESRGGSPYWLYVAATAPT